MSIEGIFANSAGPLIDISLNKERIQSVVNHEIVHSDLGVRTSYGQLLIMLHKNAMFDDRAKVIYDELFAHINRMQERAAVNIELLTCYISDGEDAYNKAIEAMKEKNRTYYNHFRKLCCINGRVHSKEDASDAISGIMCIALLAMNVDLDRIPFEKFFDAKDIQRFFSQDDNDRKYNPNRRFDELVNLWFRENNKSADTEQIQEGTILLEEINNIETIHNHAERAAIKIFSTSPIKERLISRIKTVGTKQTELAYDNAKYLTIYPAELNNPQSIPKFECLDFQAFQRKLSEQQRKVVIVTHQIGGFEDIYICCMQKETQDNTFYIHGTANEYDFLLLLQKLNCTTIFMKTKIVERMHKSLKQVIGKLPIFIYYDSAVIGALDFIKKFYCGGQYYFINHDGYLLLVVYKRSFYSIFNLMESAQTCMEEILKEYGILLSINQEFLNEVDDIHEFIQSSFRNPASLP